MLARKIIGLCGAILFATAAVVARGGTGAALLAGLRTVALATAVALGGVLVVVGLLSTALTMSEIDRFSGVKAVIVLPPLLALAVYLFSGRFGRPALAGRDAAFAPVRVYQLAAGLIVMAAAFIYISRSGNQSDIAPSSFELALRSNLTALLSVRPRFKEFLIGFPLMMLLPALRVDHRRAVGWLFALGIGVGTADIVDTFSHLHTPLLVSLLRVVNGLVIGCGLGAIAVTVYRAILDRLAPPERWSEPLPEDEAPAPEVLAVR